MRQNDSKLVRKLTKLLTLATQGIFMYKDKIYKQTDGVAMGSPLHWLMPLKAKIMIKIYNF